MTTYHLIYRKTSMVLATAMCAAFFFASCQKGSLQKAPPALGSISDDNKSFASSANTTISNGLIAYWPLSNFTNDLSGNGNNGTASNVTATTDRAGNTAGAYSFNGTTSSVSVANQTALSLHNTDFSINAWVNLSNSGGGNIVSKRLQGDTTGWIFSIGNNQIAFGPGGGATHAIATPTINTNQWYMVTVTYTLTSKKLDIYVNGVLSDSTFNVPSPGLLNAGLYIGKDDPGAGSGYYFPGSIGDVRMYSRSITTTEINELYTASCAPTGSIVAYWPFANTVSDLSGNGNNGTTTAISTGTDRLGNSLGAYQFNGTTSYISVADNQALRLNNTDFTLSAWVYLNASTGGYVLDKRTSGANNGYLFNLGNNQISYGPGGGSVNVIDNTTINTGQWYLMTGTYSLANQQFKMYLNGILISTTNNILTPNGALSTIMYIGKDNPTNAGYFNGSMSDIRIYSRILSNTDVTNLYNALD